jgi:polyhydroxybutyrate depolymerase
VRPRPLLTPLLVALALSAGCAGPAPAPSPATAPASPPATAPAPGTGTPATRAGCGHPAPVPVGQSVTRTLTSGGRARTYLLHLPAGYRPDRPLPVVLAFHGRKGTGHDIEGFSGIDGLDAIAVYPIGLPAATDGETAWQGAPGVSGVDDVRFVSDVLDQLSATVCVDPARVYATGKSEGGGLAALLSCRLPGRIAAFGTVSAAFYPGTDAGCAGAPPVPLVDFHGTGDTIMKYGGGVSHTLHYPAMTEVLDRFAARDHCSGAPAGTPIGPDVTHLVWSGCAPGSALEHYRIAGGGHTWPGALAGSGPGRTTDTISATAVMWAFFQAHPRR